MLAGTIRCGSASRLSIASTWTRKSNGASNDYTEAHSRGNCGGGAAVLAGWAASAKTVGETANTAGQFQTLIAAVKAAGRADTLSGSGPFTVFAPTDAAFAALPEGTVADLLKPENREKLVATLTYHVLPGAVTSGALAGTQLEAETVQGSALAIGATDGMTVGGAKVVQADIVAENGVIHVIDKVLLPN